MRWLLATFVALTFIAIDAQQLSSKQDPLGGPKPLGRPVIRLAQSA